MKNKIELLAPAGSMESLVAAIQNGANAVYLGGQNFSARASANNFSNEELSEAVFYGHFRNVKIYVTVNTILDEREVEEAIGYISYLYKIGVDGIIVQDLGLAKAIRDNFKDIELHASTQMTINSLEGAKYLEENGFSRVVLARETPLEEARLIAENTNLEIEAFAHGALCISYSGQCLMSSIIGGRSGNRGRCAQPCRKSYEVITRDGKSLKDRAYLLSPMDLYTLENIEKMISSGINSIKLEGRMKRPEYVSTVVSAYRKAIDGLSIKGEKEKLKQAFNRGFTKGVPFDAFGKDLVESSRPDNRGIEIGKIVSLRNKKATINIEGDLYQGDVLEFDTKSNRKTYQVNADYKKGQVTLSLPFVPLEKSQVRRIRNFREFERAKESYSEDKLRRPITLNFYGYKGQVPRLELISGDYKKEVLGTETIEGAKKSPMDQEKIKKQLEKLGDTSFSLEELNIFIDDDIFIPVSILNSLRRDLTSAFEDYLYKNSLRDEKKVSINKNPKSIEKTDLKLSVSLETIDQFYKIDPKGISRFYLRFLDQKIYRDLLDQGKEVYYRSSKILFHKDLEEIKDQIKDIEMTGISVDNLGSLYAFRDKKLVSDTGLNIFNSHGIDLLNENGLEDIILSLELTLSQIQDIRRRTESNLEVTGYGFYRVMTMKHCPFSLIKSCGPNRNCETCNFRQGYSIRDEKNVDFRVERNRDLSTVFNSYPLVMVDYIKEIKEAGIDYLLLDFTFEENPQEIIDEFIKKLSGKTTDLSNKLKEKWTNITYGHYFRGVE